MYDFNNLIKNRKAKMLNFPGASSRQLLHYMGIHLEGIQVDTVVINIGVNDLLNYSNQSRTDPLITILYVWLKNAAIIVLKMFSCLA